MEVAQFPDTDPTVLRLSIVAGRWQRGAVRRALRQFCFDHEYRLDIDEDRGVIESLLLVRIEIPQAEAKWAIAILQRWANDCGDLNEVA